jgi:hypothetical protein
VLEIITLYKTTNPDQGFIRFDLSRVKPITVRAIASTITFVDKIASLFYRSNATIADVFQEFGRVKKLKNK